MSGRETSGFYTGGGASAPFTGGQVMLAGPPMAASVPEAPIRERLNAAEQRISGLEQWNQALQDRISKLENVVGL